jgi:hypothetical protein
MSQPDRIKKDLLQRLKIERREYASDLEHSRSESYKVVVAEQLERLDKVITELEMELTSE